MTRTKLLSLALALAAIGCGGTDRPPAVSDPTPGDATLASVTLRASFPAGAVDPSLISTATSTIVVSWTPELAISSAAGSVTLSPSSPTANRRLPVGRYFFKAEARDAGNTVLETSGTAGKLIAGENAVAILFVTGKWTFVDGADAPFPVELVTSTADSSARLELASFSLVHRWFMPAPAAIDRTIPLQYNEYDLTWATNDTSNPNKDLTQLRFTTQFGGGASNQSVIDGGDYNETLQCGDCSNGPGAVGERSFRIAGDFGEAARAQFDGARALAPFSFTPEIRSYSTRMVDGRTIKGHVFEWTVLGSAVPTVQENLTPPPPAVVHAPATAPSPIHLPNVLVNEAQPIVLCRDGFNGVVDPDTVATTGDWDFTQWDCPEGGGPCVPNGDCIVRDGGGNFLYATCGSLPPAASAGECNWGLAAATFDQGEWCDTWDWMLGQCTGGPGNGIVEPEEFRDLNHDGVVDTGSFYFRHVLSQTATLDVWLHPFTAKGTQLGEGVSIAIQ